jgi:hypothetical protein
MFNKINVLQIILEHAATLKEHGNSRPSRNDWFLFFGLPIFASAILVYEQLYLTDAVITALLACISVLTGLLFNVLVLIFSAIRKELPANGDTPSIKENKKLKTQLLRETFANISFSVLMGIVICLLSVIATIHCAKITPIITFLLYFSVANFVLTLLMVLKRINTLLGYEIDHQ